MPRSFFALFTAAALWGSIPQFAPAQEVTFQSGTAAPTVAELFSSEGCSSCPPAEAYLGRMKDSPQLWKSLFPVEFHVDYWDGLGWPDRFARAAYTQRQRSYAAHLRQDSVYTPEFIVNGHEWRGFFSGGALPTATAASGRLNLKADNAGAKITVAFDGASGPQAPTVNVALLGMGIVSQVQRGENAGQRLSHDFVVLDFASAPMKGAGSSWKSESLSLRSHTIDQASAVVAWVSSPSGKLLQATGGWLKSPAVASAAP